MSIRIEIVVDTYDELVSTLRQMIENFSSSTSVHTLDTDQHSGHSQGASSVETTEGTEPVKRSRGRPPKAKAVETPTAATEATTDEAPAAPAAPEITAKDIEEVVTLLTQKFQTGDADRKASIRKWRDDIGLPRLTDMKAEHVPSARELLAGMEG